MISYNIDKVYLLHEYIGGNMKINKIKKLLFCCIIVICSLTGCDSTKKEINRTKSGLTKALSVLEVDKDESGIEVLALEPSEMTDFYIMGKIGELTPHYTDSSQTETDALFWISEEESTKTDFEEFLSKLSTYYGSEYLIDNDNESYYWKLFDEIKAYAWLDENTHINCSWIGPKYLTYSSEQYGNKIIASYFPEISTKDEKWWAFVLSYQGRDISELLETGAVNLDEWVPAEEYTGDYDIFYYEDSNKERYAKEGSLFSKSGCFVIEIASKTKKFYSLRFISKDETIDDIQQSVCDLMQTSVKTSNYSTKANYSFVNDGIFHIYVYHPQGRCELEAVHTDSYTEMVDLSFEENFEENQGLYNKIVAGYWALRKELKKPSSLVVVGVRINDERIIYKYRALNSFLDTVTEYAIYNNGSISNDYADIYYDSIDSEVLSWTTITRFSRSNYCNYKEISED